MHKVGWIAVAVAPGRSLEISSRFVLMREEHESKLALHWTVVPLACTLGTDGEEFVAVIR
jgi:hypothetical protein